MTEHVQWIEGFRRVDNVPDDLTHGVKLFTNRLCPFAHRSYWSALEKGIEKDIEFIHVELGKNKPEWFSKVSPFGTVPVLYDHGHQVLESNNVSEYFEDKHKHQGTALLPEDPLKRATIRLIISRFDSKVVAPLYALLRQGGDESKYQELSNNLRQALITFNDEVVKAAPTGPNLAGDFSLADIVVLPFLVRFEATLGHYRQFELLPDDGKHDRLRSAFAAAKARPAFQKTNQPADFYVWAYESYAATTGYKK